MSVRFDAAADRLLRTASLLSFNAAYTWMLPVYLTSDLNADTTILCFNTNDGVNFENEDWLGCDTDGVTLQVYCNNGGSFSTANGAALSIGQWATVAMVRETSTSLRAYIATSNFNLALTATNTTNITGRTSATRQEMGGEYSTNDLRLDGRVGNTLQWSEALSAAQLRWQVRQVRPVRWTNLYGWWPRKPGATERLADYSGNGRNDTAGGTLTDEADPVLFQAMPQFCTIGAGLI